MRFTFSWLKEHLDTQADVGAVVEAMTMAGLEVEHVEDPGKKLAAFTVARIVEAVQHPNADKLRVCQVDTRDGRLEIVCGAPNARAGLTTIYAPIGAYVPGLGVTLVEKPFTKDGVRPDKPGLAMGSMIHPGHPLMLAVTDIILEQHANLLRQGAVLVDPADEGLEPHLLFLLTHEIKSGEPTGSMPVDSTR